MTKTAKKKASLATVKGSGNVFADLGCPNAELLQLKALLAAEIVRTLGNRALTVRQAEVLTGTAAADFSRLKGADLTRFTVDRLMTILAKLDCEVRVNVKVKCARAAANAMAVV